MYFPLTYAQDTIVMKNLDVVPAKVTKVGESEIEFKQITNIDGPDYTLKKNKVAGILYKNKQMDVFNTDIINKYLANKFKNNRINKDVTKKDEIISINKNDSLTKTENKPTSNISTKDISNQQINQDNNIAYDVILFRNGDEIKAKVEEIGTTEIKYKKIDNPNGPVITVLKSDVFKITYSNGTNEVFNK
jgi:hypothetical protein